MLIEVMILGILLYIILEYNGSISTNKFIMDNQDIFSLFDQNVPFELRLRDAINNDLVVPFHYYGIRDQLVDYSSKDKMTIDKNISNQNNI